MPPVALTHYSDWDEPGRLKVRALCGTYIRRRDHVNDPSCIVCRQALQARDERDARAGLIEDKPCP